MSDRFRDTWAAVLRSGVVVEFRYDHMTGRFDATPCYGRGADRPAEVMHEAREICHELSGNYFYMRDVKDALREAGIDTSTIPSY